MLPRVTGCCAPAAAITALERSADSHVFCTSPVRTVRRKRTTRRQWLSIGDMDLQQPGRVSSHPVAAYWAPPPQALSFFQANIIDIPMRLNSDRHPQTCAVANRCGMSRSKFKYMSEVSLTIPTSSCPAECCGSKLDGPIRPAFVICANRSIACFSTKVTPMNRLKCPLPLFDREANYANVQ